MKTKILIGVALMAYSFVFVTNEFKDSRNGVSYKTKEINGVEWMTENLQFKSKSNLEAVNVYNDSIYAKDSTQGYFYAIADFKNVIPAGWRLPKVAEVKKLYENHSQNATSMFPTAEGKFYLSEKDGGSNEMGFSAKKLGAIDLDQYSWWKKQQERKKNANNNSFDAFSSALDNAENRTYHPHDMSISGWYCTDDYGDVTYFYYDHKTNKMQVAVSSRNMTKAFHLRLVKIK